MGDAPEMTFEDAVRRLEAIVSTLESGRGELEESLAMYEEGARLLRRCRQLLDGAERRVEILKRIDENGAPVLESADENALRSLATVAGRQSTPAAPPLNRPASGGERRTADAEQLFPVAEPSQAQPPSSNPKRSSRRPSPPPSPDFFGLTSPDEPPF